MIPFVKGEIATADKLNGNFAGKAEKVASIAALKQLQVPGASDAQTVIVDGFDRPHVWSATSTATDDGVISVNPNGNSGNGRWKLALEGCLMAEWYGAVGDGLTNSQTAMTNAYNAAVANNLELRHGPGVFLGVYSVRANGVAIRGAGSALTTLRTPAGVDTNVLELGNTAQGNSAPNYDRINIAGFTLDGNKANTPQPATDLTGWGMPLTYITHSKISDIRCINCWNGGYGQFINSDYNQVEVYVESCGGTGTPDAPGFDINSSHHNIFKVVSVNCKHGGRMLDNCWGNIVDITIKNATANGFVYNNQAVNQSYANKINVNVIGGCTTAAFQLGANCRTSEIILNTQGVTGPALYEPQQSSAAYLSNGNNITVNSNGGQVQSSLLYGQNNTYTINSYQDGRGGAQFSSYAVDVYGSNNTFKAVNIIDSATAQVRNVSVKTGASNNRFNSIAWTNGFAIPVDDSGTNTYINNGQGFGGQIASANPMTIPFYGDIFEITGTATLASIPANGLKRTIKLKFDSALAIANYGTAGSNIYLKGGANLNVTANQVIELVSDGTNWYQV